MKYSKSDNFLRSFFAPVLIITVLLAVTLVTPTNAEVTRGCQGVFLMQVTNPPVNKGATVIDFFEGRGACKNKHHGNTCRVRAKDNIFRCANELWDKRWDFVEGANQGVLPSICSDEFGHQPKTGARKVGPFIINHDGNRHDIKYTLEHYACCVVDPDGGKLSVRFSVQSKGDKGCGKKASSGQYVETRTIYDGYIADCPRIRARGGCERPYN